MKKITHNLLIYKMASIITTNRGFLFACPEVTFYYNLKNTKNPKVGDKYTIQRRVDLIGIFVRGSIMNPNNWDIIGYEIKTDLESFKSDNKWKDYYYLCNKVYIVCPRDAIQPMHLPESTGLIYLTEEKNLDYYKVRRNAKSVINSGCLSKGYSALMVALRHIGRTGAWPIYQFLHMPYDDKGSGIKYRKKINLDIIINNINNSQLEFNIDYDKMSKIYYSNEEKALISRYGYQGKKEDRIPIKKSSKREYGTKKKFPYGRNRKY